MWTQLRTKEQSFPQLADRPSRHLVGKTGFKEQRDAAESKCVLINNTKINVELLLFRTAGRQAPHDVRHRRRSISSGKYDTEIISETHDTDTMTMYTYDLSVPKPTNDVFAHLALKTIRSRQRANASDPFGNFRQRK